MPSAGSRLPWPSRPRAASDEELARRAQEGCRASLDELLRRWQVPVLHFLRHRAAPGEAEDLLQETFLRVFTHLEQYRSRWAFRTWLFTIARRVAINGRRRPASPGARVELEAVVESGADPAELAARADSRAQLWEAAGRVLSEEESSALWLHYVEGLAAREVARVLGKSSIAVKVQIHRARKKLLPELRRLGHAPEGCRASGGDKSEEQFARA